MATSQDSILLPLSPRDCAIGGVGLSVAFVLEAKPDEVDVQALSRYRAGCGQMAFSGRAGRLRQGASPDKLSPFAQLPALTRASGQLIPLPSLTLIKPATVPSSLAAYAKSACPITTWHVATLRDATIVGLSVPHGCFDATGLGLVVKALDAELHGRDWVVPPLNAGNQLEKRLAEVQKMYFTTEEKASTPPPMIGWTGAWPLSNVVKLLANGAFESLWHKAQDGCVFVGKDLLAQMVQEVKAKVQQETDGKEYVSEGDVLINWFFQASTLSCPFRSCLTARANLAELQAVYQYDPSPPTSFFASCAVSLRELVATPEMQLHLYPHNAVSGYSLNSSSPLNTAGFLATPLWQLALQHRRILAASRTLPAVQALLDWVNTNTTPSYPAIPQADCGWIMPFGKRESTGYWIYSNQIAADMPSIAFASALTGEKLRLKGFFELGSSLDQFAPVNEVEEGWIFMATMRKARWSSVGRTVRELEEARKGE
ncbi:hypothetical protein JCM11641_001815 [Rhodosporidiobolus odoratus]